MKVLKVALAAIIFGACTLQADRQTPVPYTAVEVDRFVAAPGVAFPSDYQSALADDIAREISLLFQTVVIARQGQAAPYAHALLRLTGVVTRFKPGNKTKRHLIGFGAGATVVEAQVWFIDAATGQVLLNREVKGITWTGIGGGDAQGAADSVAKKIAKLCNAAHLFQY